MGKIDFINQWVDRKEFLIRFWGTFLTVLALPSAILTIAGAHISVRLTAGLIVLALAFAVILNRSRLVTKNLPPGMLPEEFERRRIHCPCDLKLTDQVGRLAQQCYGDGSISRSQYEPLRVKNPNILACLTGARGEFLGYFDVIPLNDHFGTMFLKGRVTEKEITHEDILAPHEMAKCNYLYIAGFAVRNWEHYSGYHNALILVWALLRYLDHFYGKINALAFAVAFTKEGQRLLETFTLKLEGDGSTRVDKHSAYSLVLTPEEIARRLACVPDYSSICSLDWARMHDAVHNPSATPNPRRPLRRHQVPRPLRNVRSLSSPTERTTRFN
jgi:hypothetical protein